MGSVNVFGHTLNDWNLLLAIGASLATIITLLVTLRPKGKASSQPPRSGWLEGLFSGLGLGMAFGVSSRSSAPLDHEIVRGVAESLPSFIDPTVGHAIGHGAHVLAHSDAHRILEQGNPADLIDLVSNITGP